ncbi:MAG: hypothetical protein ACRD2S_00425 [Terriglobales bacterium]
MRRLAIAILLTALARAAQTPQPDPQTRGTTADSGIVVPAGTTVLLSLTNPVMAKTAKPGDIVYAETAFPIAVKNRMAIPAGTYVQGQIDTLTRPGRRSPHAQFQIHFSKIIFTNGYTVELPKAGNTTQQAPQEPITKTGTAAAQADDVIAAVATPYVEVSSVNDVLLDNGSQIEMFLQIPLLLNAENVAAAVRRSNPGPLPQFRSATRCLPTPGSPGSSDTVIPGTSGMPGTPDTVIPGVNGMPDTIIPGIPATPSSPDTIIPGTPGTPGISCPAPPVVIWTPKVADYKQSFQIATPALVSGKQLAAGSYQVGWNGSGPSAVVDILQNGSLVVSARARFVLLSRQSSADVPETRTNSDGSVFLRSLRFAGQAFALYFDSNGA